MASAWSTTRGGCYRRRPARSRRWRARARAAGGGGARGGLGAGVVPEGMVGPGLRILAPADGLPELPMTRMGLIFAPGRVRAEAEALAEAIRDTIVSDERLRAA